MWGSERDLVVEEKTVRKLSLGTEKAQARMGTLAFLENLKEAIIGFPVQSEGLLKDLPALCAMFDEMMEQKVELYQGLVYAIARLETASDDARYFHQCP